MDVLFGKFVEDHYNALSEHDKALFDQFLNEPDVDIYAWVMDRAVPKNSGYLPFVNKLKKCL